MGRAGPPAAWGIYARRLMAAVDAQPDSARLGLQLEESGFEGLVALVGCFQNPSELGVLTESVQ